MRPTGSLLTYLRKLERGLKKENVEVDCRGCVACCADPLFEVDVSEQEAKKYKASRQIDGRYLLDRQATGECVYLIDKRCTVYADRPRTCRTYDCRYHLFGAPLDASCTMMHEAVVQWEPFTMPTTEDKVAFISLTVLIALARERDPGLSGLAYILLQWPLFRQQAYNQLQELQQQ